MAIYFEELIPTVGANDKTTKFFTGGVLTACNVIDIKLR